MRIPERDVAYIILSVYLLKLISHIRHKMDHTQVNLLQLKTFEHELELAEYIQHIDVRTADLCWSSIYHLQVTSYLRLLACSFLARLVSNN